MARYYDEKCFSCPMCHFLAKGNYPDGEEYEACRAYGYILHPEKGVSTDECKRFRTDEQYEMEQKMKNRRKK